MQFKNIKHKALKASRETLQIAPTKQQEQINNGNLQSSSGLKENRLLVQKGLKE